MDAYVIPEKIKCPGCSVLSQQIRLKESAYIVTNKRADGYVYEYKWYTPPEAYINPLFYNFWTCPNCFYTDEYKHFRKPKNTLKDFRFKFKQLKNEKDIIFDLLTSSIHFTPLQSYESSIFQTLLYLYVHGKMPDSGVNHYLLGKHYLRLSWYYKLRPNLTIVNKSELMFDPISEELMFYNTALRIFEFETMKFMVLYTGNKDDTIKIDALSDSIGKIKQIVEKLDQEIKNNQLQKVKQHKQSTLEEKLSLLKTFWEGFPLSEADAKLNAVEHYQFSIENDYFSENLSALLQAMFLIFTCYFQIEYYYKVMEFRKTVNSYLMNIILALKEEINVNIERKQQVEERLNKIKVKNIPANSILADSLKYVDEQLITLKGKLNLCRQFIKNANDLVIKSEKKIYELQLPKIHNLLQGRTFKSHQEVKALLEASKFEGFVLRHYFAAYNDSCIQKKKKRTFFK